MNIFRGMYKYQPSFSMPSPFIHADLGISVLEDQFSVYCIKLKIQASDLRSA